MRWFPVKCKGVAYARNDELAFRISPVFFLKMMKTDSLAIELDVQFIIGAKGSYSESKVDGNIVTAVAIGGPMTTEAFNIDWYSSNGNVQILGKYGKQDEGISDLSEDGLDKRILKSLFDTKKKIKKRMRITTNVKK